MILSEFLNSISCRDIIVSHWRITKRDYGAVIWIRLDNLGGGSVINHYEAPSIRRTITNHEFKILGCRVSNSAECCSMHSRKSLQFVNAKTRSLPKPVHP